MMMTSTTPSPTVAPTDRPARYFVARSSATAAALLVYGAPYQGIVWADGRLAFKFADPHDELRALAGALRRHEAPPVQPRALMAAYFDLRRDLARALAAQARRQGAPGDRGGC